MNKKIFAGLIAAALVGAFLPSCNKGGTTPEDQKDTTKKDTTVVDPVDSNYIAPGDTVRQKPMVVWIDASANYQRMETKKGIKETLDKIAKYGFNGIVVDVKPCQGTVLYESEFLPPTIKLGGYTIENRGFDYLEFILQEAKKRGLRVEVSTTIMTMGNKNTSTGPLYSDPDIAEAECVEWTPTGLHKITENWYSFPSVNPCHPNTIAYIKRMIREIFTNPKYEGIDGYVLDYCRYMNYNSDFSDYSRQKFEEYIGETVPNWPSDIFTFNSDDWADISAGKYFNQWIEWRSMNIRNVIAEIRTTLKEVAPDVELSAWAASWWPLPHTGQNWASPRYKPVDANWWATDNYHNTGYADQLDFFQLGAYMNVVSGIGNTSSVEYAMYNCKTVLKGDCPYWGTVSVSNKDFDSEAATYLCLTQSSGCMIFDLVYVGSCGHWNKIKAGVDRAWKKLGVNSPLKSKTRSDIN